MEATIFPDEKEYLTPYSFYRRMRDENPIAYDPKAKLWAVFRYDDVRTVLSDHDRFSSDFTKFDSSETVGRRKSLISMDPPEHKHSRDLLTKAFTPRAVANMEPRIAQIANDLLDQVIDKGEMDFIRDFASPLPIIVIAEMLGVPTQDRDQFRSWADELLRFTDNPFVDAEANKERRERVQAEMDDYFRGIIAQRKRDPKDDLISSLIQAEIGGEKLTEEQILSFCTLLLLAGHVTTINLLGNSMLCLTDFPDELNKLYAKPDLIPSAIEEVLRYSSPVQLFFRIANRDIDMDGRRIEKGQRIIAWIGSANRDETKFEAPDRFDVTRSPNPHIAFGYGIHFCLGAPLARLEGKAAWETLLSRIGSFTRIPGTLEPSGGFILHGVRSLPIAFEPVKVHQ
ncbi:cytochrome P450 [Paenibacillus humicola]|uniref:cytochrome P450 n=1 Tax=Paenibacillus humicola TaxID=3110540 RepID=UPI00237BF6CF|nr:cytochrome P450 [Paenibacillus humicola]